MKTSLMKNGSPKQRALKVLKSSEIGIANLKKSLPALEKAASIIGRREGEILLTGIGKSGYVAQKIAATLTSLGQRSVFLHPVEAIHGDIGVLSKGDVLIALSFSGESKEVVKIVQYAKEHFDVNVISFTKSKKTSLGRLSDVCVELNIKDEGSPGGMAPMASTTATMVLGDMLAAMLTDKSFEPSNFARFHPGGSIGLSLTKVRQVMRKGKTVPIVKNTTPALKVLKEITKKSLGVAAVVGSDGAISGIMTDGDTRRWLIEGGNPLNDKASDIMTSNPKTISEDSSLKDALELMEKHKITTLFVVDKKRKPVGLVDIHDIIESNVLPK